MTRSESLPDSAYSANSLSDLVYFCESFYAQAYHRTGNLRDLMLFLAARRFREAFTNTELHSFLRDDANALHLSLQSKFPLLKFDFRGRIKPWISYFNKAINYQDNYKALDDLHDLIAYRLILDSDYLSPEDITLECYKVLYEIVIYYFMKGYQLCYANPPSDILAEDSPLRSKLIIPKGDFIPIEWSRSVKNYIQFPKGSGYQSLHIVLRHPSSGSTIEIQIRTNQMHKIAEEGYYTEVTPPVRNFKCTSDLMEGFLNGQSADESLELICSMENPPPVTHRDYKEHKYPNPIQYDPYKIHISGFEISESGTLVADTSGFEKPFYLFQL